MTPLSSIAFQPKLLIEEKEDSQNDKDIQDSRQSIKKPRTMASLRSSKGEEIAKKHGLL